MANQDVDLKALEQEMGIDQETQKAVDESEANFWTVKDREGNEIKLELGDTDVQNRAFFDERMEITRTTVLPNTDEEGKPDGTYVALIDLKVIDPQSPNQGKSLTHRVYFSPEDKVRAARTIQRMYKALGRKVPVDKNGKENVLLGLEKLKGAKLKVNLWQGWRLRSERMPDGTWRDIPGDWNPFSPRPADFNSRSAFRKP